jgi:hypothetical protein
VLLLYYWLFIDLQHTFVFLCRHCNQRLDQKLRGDIHEDWKSLKRAVYETAMEVVGTQRRRNPRRLKIWNEDLKEAIEEKKNTFPGNGVVPKIIQIL